MNDQLSLFFLFHLNIARMIVSLSGIFWLTFVLIKSYLTKKYETQKLCATSSDCVRNISCQTTSQVVKQQFSQTKETTFEVKSFDLEIP